MPVATPMTRAFAATRALMSVPRAFPTPRRRSRSRGDFAPIRGSVRSRLAGRRTSPSVRIELRASRAPHPSGDALFRVRQGSLATAGFEFGFMCRPPLPGFAARRGRRRRFGAALGVLQTFVFFVIAGENDRCAVANGDDLLAQSLKAIAIVRDDEEGAVVLCKHGAGGSPAG